MLLSVTLQNYCKASLICRMPFYMGRVAILMLQDIASCATDRASPLPDVIHLLTEKHWLQLMVTTAGKGTVESVLAAT